MALREFSLVVKAFILELKLIIYPAAESFCFILFQVILKKTIIIV